MVVIALLAQINAIPFNDQPRMRRDSDNDVTAAQDSSFCIKSVVLNVDKSRIPEKFKSYTCKKVSQCRTVMVKKMGWRFLGIDPKTGKSVYQQVNVNYSRCQYVGLN